MSLVGLFNQGKRKEEVDYIWRLQVKYNKIQGVTYPWLEYLNLQFWRYKQESGMGNPCGGLATIGLIGLLFAAFISKFVEINQQSNVTVNTRVTSTSRNPLTNITTAQNDSLLQPFMFAIDPQPNSTFLSSQDYAFSAIYKVLDNGNLTQNASLTLQSCTKNHFSKYSEIDSVFNDYNVSRWFCLPLGRTFQVGGNEYTKVMKWIEINIFCANGSCFNNPTIFWTYTLSATPNPQNSSEPWVFSLNDLAVTNVRNVTTQVSVKFDQNKLITDDAVIPLQTKKSQNRGLTRQDQIQTVTFPFVGQVPPQLTIRLLRSGKSTEINRSYTKLSDAVSYMGGVSYMLISLFFFLGAYGQSFFSMTFAVKYFRSGSANQFGFFGWIKQWVYKILSKIKCTPDWELAKRREKIKETVNNMLDVIYLNRRIQFLEHAIEILFDEHHLKGLRLIQNMTHKEADQRFKKQKYRAQILAYFKKRHFRAESVHELQLHRGNKDNNNNQSKKHIEENKDIHIEVEPGANRNYRESIHPLEYHSEHLSEHREQRPSTHSKNVRSDTRLRSEQVETEKDDSEMQEVIEVDQLEEEANDSDINSDIQSDLKRLVTEAEESKDERSKRIFQKLDRKLKRWLRRGFP